MNEPTIEQEGIVDVMVSSGLAHNTQLPYVQVVIKAADWMTQMSPENARELAFNLLGAADAAESDSFLVWFLQDKLEVKDERAVVSVLIDFREYREKRRANANL